MTPKLAEYIETGKQLTVDERLEVAHELLLGVQEDGVGSMSEGSEWEAELLRRANEALDGTAVLHDVEESHAGIRAELAATRRK